MPVDPLFAAHVRLPTGPFVTGGVCVGARVGVEGNRGRIHMRSSAPLGGTQGRSPAVPGVASRMPCGYAMLTLVTMVEVRCGMPYSRTIVTPTAPLSPTHRRGIRIGWVAGRGQLYSIMYN